MLLHEVITTEKVPFTYRVAGLGSRFLAWLVDLGIIVVLLFMGIMAASVMEMARGGLGTAVFMVSSFVVQWGYFILFEWLWHGQTPGKRLLGIRVINWQGTSISFYQSAVRNLLRVADGLPLAIPDLVPFLYGLGFAVAACNREQRRLGDLAAGTLVVHIHQKVQPIRAIHQAATETDRARESTVRQRLEQLSREQKQTLLDVCLRRDQLRVRDRARLFAAVADYFQARFGFVPREYESQEKFVLQLAAVLTAEGKDLTGAKKEKSSQLPEAAVPLGMS